MRERVKVYLEFNTEDHSVNLTNYPRPSDTVLVYDASEATISGIITTELRTIWPKDPLSNQPSISKITAYNYKEHEYPTDNEILDECITLVMLYEHAGDLSSVLWTVTHNYNMLCDGMFRGITVESDVDLSKMIYVWERFDDSSISAYDGSFNMLFAESVFKGNVFKLFDISNTPIRYFDYMFYKTNFTALEELDLRHLLWHGYAGTSSQYMFCMLGSGIRGNYYGNKHLTINLYYRDDDSEYDFRGELFKFKHAHMFDSAMVYNIEPGIFMRSGYDHTIQEEIPWDTERAFWIRSYPDINEVCMPELVIYQTPWPAHAKDAKARNIANLFGPGIRKITCDEWAWWENPAKGWDEAFDSTDCRSMFDSATNLCTRRYLYDNNPTYLDPHNVLRTNAPKRYGAFGEPIKYHSYYKDSENAWVRCNLLYCTSEGWQSVEVEVDDADDYFFIKQAEENW